MRKNKYTAFTIAAILVLSMTMLLFGVKGSLCIIAVMLTAALAAVGVPPVREWSSIDWLLVCITVFNIFSCFHSETRLLAYSEANLSVLMLAAYWIQRKLFAEQQYAKIVFDGYSAIAAIAMMIAAATFVIYRQAVLDAGFTDTYSLRFLYRPLGYINNVWAEIAVCLFGLSFMTAGKWRLPLSTLAATAILLTFSRGAYMSAALMIVLIMIVTRKRRFLIQSLIAIMISVSVVACFCKNDLRTTISMNATVTQRNSTEWRKSKTLGSMEFLKMRPFLGYGNGSYTLVTDDKAQSDDQNTFTDIAPNILVKLLVERGIVGTLPYVILMICALCVTWKSRRDSRKGIAGCIIVAIAAKEMSQATMMNTPVILFLAYGLLAFIQNIKRREMEICNGVEKRESVVAVAFLAVWSVIYSINIHAIHLFEKETASMDKGIQNVEQFRKTHNAKYLEYAEAELRAASKKHPFDKRILCLTAYAQAENKKYLQAHDTMKQILRENSDYGLYMFIDAWNLYNLHHKAQALYMMTAAINNMPQLLLTKEMKRIERHDRLFYARLKQKIIANASRSDTQQSPVTKAKKGYILNHYGLTKQAASLLTEAVSDMPSMQTPWRILGYDRKYSLLRNGAFCIEPYGRKSANDSDIDIASVIYDSYRHRFQTWYMSDFPI